MLRLCVLLFTAGCVTAQSDAVAKVARLFEQLNEAMQSKRPVRFQLTEAEVNEYLRYARTANQRPGLDRLTVKLFPGNYVSVFASIDFDMVEQAKPGTVPPVLRPVLSGKKELSVDFRLNAAGGVATFPVEKAYFERIPLPAFVVEQLIQVIGARQPEKYDTSKPVPLPFGLRNVAIGEKSLAGEN